MRGRRRLWLGAAAIAAGAGAGLAALVVPRADPLPLPLTRATPVNLVVDGNSLAFGWGTLAGGREDMGAQGFYRLLRTRLLAAGFRDVAGGSVAIGGQSWQAMDGYRGELGNGAGDVDRRYVRDRANLLVLWETTNSAYYGRSPAAIAAEARAYVRHRLAAHPGWRVIVLGTIPRQMVPAGTGVAGFNATLVAADRAIAAQQRGWGAARFVSLREAGSPFAFADYKAARFDRDAMLWRAAERGGQAHTHLSDAGYGWVAGTAAAAIAGLAAR